MKEAIALNIKEVKFPWKCAMYNTKADTSRLFLLSNNSLFYRIISVLGIDYQVELRVPMTNKAVEEMKMNNRKSIWKGIIIGLLVGFIALVGGVALMVQFEYETWEYNLAMMFTGIIFVFTPIVFVFYFF